MDPTTLHGQDSSLETNAETIDRAMPEHDQGDSSHRRRATDAVPLGAIFSPGRSGSTWLGSMVSSHPDVEYRFEPVLRMRDFDTDVAAVDDKLQGGGSTTAAELHELFRRVDPTVTKPPFVAANSWSPVPALKGAAWALAKAGVPQSDVLFQKAMSVSDDARIVFKEVERLHLLRAVAQMPEVPIVYLLRHPASVVASRLEGIASGLMPEIDRDSLARSLANRPDLARNISSIDELSLVELEALSWRMNADAALLSLEAHPAVRVVFYEGLARDPEPQLAIVLDHLGFDESPATKRFIELSRSQASRARRMWHGEVTANGYFSVFRSTAILPWQVALPASDLDDLLAIVEGSPAMQRAHAVGEWT